MKRSRFSIAMSRFWSLPPAKWIPLGVRTTSSLVKESALLKARINAARKKVLNQVNESRTFTAINIASFREREALKPKDLRKFDQQQKAMHKLARDSLDRAEKDVKRLVEIRGELVGRKK